MKQIRDKELLKGKIIDRVCELQEELIIFLKSDEYVVINNGGWDENDLVVKTAENHFFDNYSEYDQLTLGVITQHEYDSIMELKQQQIDKFKEDLDRLKFEQLKAKFKDK